VRELRGVESERNTLRASLQDVEREAEKMNRRLNAAPKVPISAIEFSHVMCWGLACRGRQAFKNGERGEGGGSLMITLLAR